MVDSKMLKNRFGVNVVTCNLSPEERYLLSEKNVLNESAKVKIKHLNESVFDSTEEMLAFVSNNLETDVDLCNDSSPDNINSMFKAFDDYSLVNPHFDPERIETWCDGVENTLHTCAGIIDQNNVEMTEIPLNEDGSMNVPDNVLKDNIYKDLDDNSILLLYGMLTGNFSTGYVSDMRNTIYNDIKRNKENSPVGRVVLHSLKESNSMSFGSLVESYKVDICKMAQKNKTVLFEESGFVKAISKMGKNKYSVITLNESAFNTDQLRFTDESDYNSFKQLVAEESADGVIVNDIGKNKPSSDTGGYDIIVDKAKMEDFYGLSYYKALKADFPSYIHT